MIQIITLDQAKQWDDIVMSFTEFDVYYLSGYVRGFHLHGDGEPLLIYYSGKKMRAIQVVMKRDIAQATGFDHILPSGEFFDLCTPYGYGGWITEGGEEIDILMKEYLAFCRSCHIVSEFVRYHPQLEHRNELDKYYKKVHLGNTISIPLISEQDVWNNFTSKNRNVIRKAVKSGLTVHSSNSMDAYTDFMQIYAETMQRDHASPYYFFPFSYFESIYSGLKENSLVFYVKTPDGNIAAAAIILFANGRMHYHLSGSTKVYQPLAPSNLLLYEVACWGVKKGYRTFHLGGGLGAKEDSLYAFKKAFFRGKPLQYNIGKIIIDPPVYQDLVNKRDSITNNLFFPQYRG